MQVKLRISKYHLCCAIAIVILVAFSLALTLIKVAELKDILTQNFGQDATESFSTEIYPSGLTEYSQERNLSADYPLEPLPEPEYSTLEVKVTAYCCCVKCCGIWSAEHESRIGTDYIQKTSSGTIPEEGRTIATDPKVIPTGSFVIIDGHQYIAEDVGGAIKGNRIDLYFDSHEEALEWGVRTREVIVYAE